MDLSFCDLRAKQVINVSDGKCLGNIIDLVFDSCTCRVKGLVVPTNKGVFNFFKSNTDIFIPFRRVIKIGKDVILVEINANTVIASAEEELDEGKKDATNNEKVDETK